MRFTLVLLVSLAVPLPVQSQQGGLEPGARVKLKHSCEKRQDGSVDCSVDRGSESEIEGVITAWDTHALTIEPKDRAPAVTVPHTAVVALEVKESAPVWEYESGSDISVIAPAPLGSSLLLVGTKAGLISLDAGTGERQWVRSDLREVGPYEISLAYLQRPGESEFTVRGIVKKDDDYMTVIDLADGESIWESRSSQMKKVGGGLLVSSSRIFLVYGQTEASKSTLIAVDLKTGEMKWRQDDLFDKAPELFEYEYGGSMLGGRKKVRTLAGHQPPMQDTDSTFILAISKDGPLKVHLETGSPLWGATDLRGKRVPADRMGYPQLLKEDELLFVPFEDKLLALMADDGTAAWDTVPKLRSRVVQMKITVHGLLVRGADVNGEGQLRDDPFLDLIDPGTGRSLWTAPIRDVKITSDFIVRGDTAYLSAEKELVAINIPDGSRRVLAEYEFEGGEKPGGLQIRDEGFVLISTHNLMLIDHEGQEVYQRYYRTPGVGFGEAFTSALLEKALPSQRSRLEEDHLYMFTNTPSEEGWKGYCIVKLRKTDGREVGRVWLDDRTPEYRLGALGGMVFFKREKKELAAFRF